jgi:tetratricopeptide (TPR) repeat protein
LSKATSYLATEREQAKSARAAAASNPGLVEGYKLAADMACGLAVDSLRGAYAALDPTDKKNRATVLGNIASAYAAIGDHKTAGANFALAIQEHPTAPLYMNLSPELAAQNRLDDAQEACAQAIALDATNASVCWLNIAIVLDRNGRDREALVQIKRSIVADPKSAKAYYVLGDVQRKSGTLAGAVKAYRTSLSLAPNGEQAESARLALKELHAAPTTK